MSFAAAHLRTCLGDARRTSTVIVVRRQDLSEVMDRYRELEIAQVELVEVIRELWRRLYTTEYHWLVKEIVNEKVHTYREAA